MSRYVPLILDAITEISTPPAGVTLGPDTKFEAELGFESGAFIELFLIIEENVDGFFLGSARLAQEDFATVEALSNFIERRMKELEEEMV